MKSVLTAIADEPTLHTEQRSEVTSAQSSSFQGSPPATISPRHLVNLVQSIRPSRGLAGKRREIATRNIKQLINLLRDEPELRAALSSYISCLLNASSHAPLYTESGILPQSGFFSEGFQKIAHVLLPPVHDPKSLRGLVNLVFHENDDYIWFCALDNSLLVALLELLRFDATTPTNVHKGSYKQLLNTALALSHKIAAMGVEPEIASRLPEYDDLDTPFVAQHTELAQYVQFIVSNSIHPRDSDSMEDDHALVMLKQCDECIEYLRKRRDRFGASLPLTYRMQRIEQHVQRLRQLIKLTIRPDESDPWSFARRVVALWKEVVEAENQQHSLSKYLNDLTGLLAFQVSENAAKRGEHYITVTRKEYNALFRAAMGGGAVVALLVCFKLYFSYRHFPPFVEALAFSLNYAVGFITIHLLGFTLATKQPAMTASTIANSLDTKKQQRVFARKKNTKRGKRSNRVELDELVVMISQVSRSQLVSFVGNVLLAFPVAFVVEWAYFFVAGEPMADRTKAHKMLHDLHPLESLALIHAGIAGVFLFTSGLISGYYDNMVVHNNIPERVRQHPLVRRFFAKSTADKLAHYTENNLGAIAGNFFFGFMLGTASTIGFIFGLPIDIRHITFSAGNFAIALGSLMNHISLSQVCWSLVGIAGIGFMNFIVSFSLALFTALRSRQVRFSQTGELVQLLWQYFRQHAGEFFFPPKNAKPQPDEQESTLHAA